LERTPHATKIAAIDFTLFSKDHSKNKTPFLGMLYTCFGYEMKTGLVRILVIFQDRPVFSNIIHKVSARAFD